MSDTATAETAVSDVAVSDQATSMDAILNGGATQQSTDDKGLKDFLNRDAPQPVASFLDGFTDPDLKGYIERKGFKDIEGLGKSYAGLERMMSSEARVPMPSDANDAEGWDRAFKALGRPDTPEGYGLTDLAGADQAFAQNAAQWLHAAGVSTQHASALANSWNNYVSEQATAQQAKFDSDSRADWAGIKTEWGDRFDEGVEHFRRGVTQFGLTSEDMGQIERALGTAKTVRTFAKIGSGLSEDTFVQGEGRQQFAMSKDQAEARLASLRNNPEWQARWSAGGAPEKEEFDRLTAAIARAAG